MAAFAKYAGLASVLLFAVVATAQVPDESPRRATRSSERFQAISIGNGLVFVIDTATGQCWSKILGGEWVDEGNPTHRQGHRLGGRDDGREAISRSRPVITPVEGIVSLDGQPLEGALVMFTPVEGGRPAAGRTDAEGRYELTYTKDRKGALPGAHVVSISTFLEGDPAADQPGVPEKLPAQYNVNSELTATVEAGSSNTLDFDLTSDLPRRRVRREEPRESVFRSEAREPRLTLEGDRPVEITIHQRERRAIPGSDETLFVQLGDITEGQVLVSIHDEAGETIVEPKSLMQGQSLRFSTDRDGTFRLKVDQLRNLLTGNDFAELHVTRSTDDGDEPQ